MDIKLYLKALRFYAFSGLYLFLVFGSIYGLFVEEITLFTLSFSGSSKNIICAVGLLIAGAASMYPIISIVYKALSNSNSN